MEVAKKDLTEYLNTPFHTYRKWSDERLKEELLKNCWRVTNVYKRGRSVIYVLQYEEQDFDIIGYVKEEFKVRNGDKFVEHTSERVNSIKKDIPMSPESIGKKIGVPKQTCVDWDNKLERKGIISKTDDEYLYYFKYSDGRCIQVNREEYDNYCKTNKVILSEMQDLYKRMEAGEISKGYFEVNHDALKDKLKDGIKAYKLCKYELNENDPCYQRMKDYLGL